VGRQICETIATAADGSQSKALATMRVDKCGLDLLLTSPQTALVDHEITTRVAVLNTGTLDARNVQIVQELPTGLKFAGASDGGTLASSQSRVRWLLPLLSAGQKREFTVKLVAKVCGDLTQRASVRADPGGEARSETVLHVGGIPALDVEISNREKQIEVGADTTYDIRVVNQGTWAGTGVQVVALVPEGMAGQGAEGPAAFRTDRQRVIFEPIAKVNPGSAISFRVRVRGIRAGDWRFQVQLTSNQLRVPLTREESTLVYKDK
jgi:uncharacterized repeat protein (TIGR01451 family)